MSSSKVAASDKRIVWLTNSLGYGDDLLYWGPILTKYVQSFPNAQFYTAADGRKSIPASNHTVERLPSIRIPLGRRRFSYDRHIRLVSPSALRVINATQPDALVISEFTMPSLLATYVRRRQNVPTLLLVESDPLRGNPHRLGFLKRKLRSFVARNVDWVLTNNEAGRRYVESNLPVAPDRVLCSPYVVSEVPMSANAPALCDPRNDLADEDKIVFLYVGQLIERKGLSQLIAAVGQLSNSHRALCSFWIVGDGNQRGALEHLISQHGLQEQVKIVGRRPYSELSAYYRSADVFVMPTLDDYRALVGFEALAYGLPLLHSRYDGAVGELVEEGKNGFVVDPQREQSLVHGIERCIALNDKLKDFSEYSLLRSKPFTIQRAVDSLVDATYRCLQTS